MDGRTLFGSPRSVTGKKSTCPTFELLLCDEKDDGCSHLDRKPLWCFGCMCAPLSFQLAQLFPFQKV